MCLAITLYLSRLRLSLFFVHFFTVLIYSNKLNLTNLHAQNLYLWNCVLQNLDLSNSFIDGFQLINADLIDINLQGATIHNLQLCSDIPIVGSTCWHEGRTYSVVLKLPTRKRAMKPLK